MIEHHTGSGAILLGLDRVADLAQHECELGHVVSRNASVQTKPVQPGHLSPYGRRRIQRHLVPRGQPDFRWTSQRLAPDPLGIAGTLVASRPRHQQALDHAAGLPWPSLHMELCRPSS
jgi:hypothetical protein